MPSQSPYAPPKSSLIDETRQSIHRQGKYVVYEPTTQWPHRCFKCNDETRLKKTVKLTYLNPWFYLTVLITPILTIILYVIFGKKFVLGLPVCEHHNARRRTFLVVQWVMFISMIIALTFAIFLDSGLLYTLTVGLFIGVVVTAIFGRQVSIAKFKDGQVWVAGTGEAFRDSL